MNSTIAGSDRRHMLSSHDIELDDSASASFAGAGTSGTDATSVSHLLRPDHASGETKIPVRTNRASSPSRRASWTSSWIYEICAIVVSVAFMVAIVVVLNMRIDRKLRSSWTLPLAPNTVIALFSTLSKSAILLVITACISQLKWIYFGRRGHRVMDLQTFDDASRGPLGAISLIVRIRWGATIASFGALLTILALAQDAFYQQIYSTDFNSTIQQGQVASLAVTRCQDSGSLDSGYTTSSVFSNIRGLSASVLSGISVPQDPSFNCPSGNCTWGAYETLGICSSCEDVSNKAQRSCKLDASLNTIYCDYNIPTSESINITLSTVMIASTSEATAGGTILNSTTVSLTVSGYTSRAFVRIGILRVDSDEYAPMRERPGNYTDVPKSLHVCELAWCLKSYESAEVNNGVLKESLQTNPPLLQDAVAGYEASMKNCTENFGYSLTYKLLGGQQLDLQTPRLFEIFRLCPDIMKISEEENIYIVNYNDERSIQQAINAILQNGAVSTTFFGLPPAAIADVVYSANDGDIAKTFDNIAQSLTNQIRSGPQSLKINGQVLRTELYMSVDWPWLAYPVALLTAASAFLIVCIVVSVKGNRVSWKSSIVAPLFHGLEGWPDESLVHERVEDMNKSAKEMYVKLERDRLGRLALVRR